MEFKSSHTLEEILNDEYLAEHTGFNSLEDLKSNAPVRLEGDLTGIDSEELNSFISENSKFESWLILLNHASREMVIKKFRDGGHNVK